MNNLSTAIGMYEADRDRPPIGSGEGMRLGLWTNDNRIAWLRLTTPIAYIQSIPTDPFGQPSSGIPIVETIKAHYVYNTNANPNERSGTLGFMWEVGFVWYMFSPGPGLTENRVPLARSSTCREQ